MFPPNKANCSEGRESRHACHCFHSDNPLSSATVTKWLATCSCDGRTQRQANRDNRYRSFRRSTSTLCPKISICQSIKTSANVTIYLQKKHLGKYFNVSFLCYFTFFFFFFFFFRFVCVLPSLLFLLMPFVTFY